MDNNEQTTQPLTYTSGGSDKHKKYSGPPKWRSSRFLLAYLILGGNAAVFFQRVSFSMVMVCMVNHTALDILHQQHTPGQGHSPPHPVLNVSRHQGGKGVGNMSVPGYSIATSKTAFQHNNSTTWNSAAESQTVGRGGPCDKRSSNNKTGSEEKEDGPFIWTKETQGLLLGAVYWGYMATQIFGGYLFYLFGPRNVTALSMLIMSVLIMLCHPAALWSPWAVFVLRVAVGVCTSFAMPSMYAIWGQWAPKGERATLLSLSFSGQNVANSAVFPTAALLCKYGFAGGWPSVFYVYGLLGVVWCVAWMVVVSDSPETSRWIHPEERDYIMTHRGQVSGEKSKLYVPWCSIFGSIAFWAIAAGHVTFTWGLFLFMSNLPLYMYEVMNFDIKSNGFYSMLPYLALFFVQTTGGFFADFLVRRQIMTVFWVRRLVTVLASLVPAVALVIMSYLDCTQVAAVMSLLVISVGFMGFAFSGFLVNPFDIAPRYAVSLTSVTNSLACIPGIVTPYLVAEVTTDQTREQWQIIFFITGGVYVCGTLFFCIFAQTSIQTWAQPPTQLLNVQPLQVIDDKAGWNHPEKAGCHLHPENSGCPHPENSECHHLEKSQGLQNSDSPHPENCHHPENCQHSENSGCVHPEKPGCRHPDDCEHQRLMDGNCERSQKCDSAKKVTKENGGAIV